MYVCVYVPVWGREGRCEGRRERGRGARARGGEARGHELGAQPHLLASKLVDVLALLNTIY